MTDDVVTTLEGVEWKLFPVPPNRFEDERVHEVVYSFPKTINYETKTLNDLIERRKYFNLSLVDPSNVDAEIGCYLIKMTALLLKEIESLKEMIHAK